MRIVLVLLALALVALPALASEDIAKGDRVYMADPVQHQNQIDQLNPGAALVASIIAGTFTDLGPAYVSALGAAGETPVDLIYDPMGAWPPMGGYEFVMVDCSDLWWSGYFLASDEAVLASYIDAGGCMTLVGQDYLYQRGYYTGFPMTHLGLGSAYEDANYGDTFLNYNGTAGGPIAGISGSMTACFAANPFFTDDITPAVQGVVTWDSATWGPAEGGCMLNKAAFSTVEFGCDASHLNQVVAGLLTLCGPIVPTENTSWGQLKGMFR